MQELLAALPMIAGIVEKGGVSGVLLVVVATLAWALVKQRAELLAVYKQRDRARLVVMAYQTAAKANNIVVDLSGIADLTAGDVT